MKKYRWVVKEKVDSTLVDHLSKKINISPELAHILCQRGYTSFDSAKSFFRPNIDELHDPFLMKDMGVAVNRLSQAIYNNEKILIYGDYDVDGTTSVALVYSFIKNFYQNIDYYIPDRYAEGYGISTKGIDFASEHNFTLVISLDCGIKAIDKIDYANTKGIDFIICDHHRPGETIPNAKAVLDPKRTDCSYPFKELSGCGVGFKLIEAFSVQNGIEVEKLYDYLDYLAISIAADIVPIVDENRILAYYGLKKINENPRLGIKTLIELAGIENEVTINSLVFGFAPRINAAGRLGDAKNAVKLLVEESSSKAEKIGAEINKTNLDRRELDSSITDEALEMISSDVKVSSKKTTVLYNESWHKGVVGIVASRCIESYYRPTIILTKSNGSLSGSARSVADFDVYNAIENCSAHLEQFGGHKYAAGLTLKEENLQSFMDAFENEVSSTITEDMLIPKINIDTGLDLRQLTPSFYNIIKQMEPFGPKNMQPIFVSKGVVDSGYSRVVGEKHLKLSINHNNSATIDGIAFGMAEYYEQIKRGNPFDICYSVELNKYRGNVSLQLKIRDIRTNIG